MGLLGGGQLWHSIRQLTLPDVLAVARHRRRQRGSDGNVCIDIDANLLAFKYKKDPISGIINFCSILLNEGAHVTVIADKRDYRHHSKRATTMRQAQREDARLNATLARVEVMNLHK